MWWLLCREVLRLRGTISRELSWEVMPDLFFYRDPEEVRGRGIPCLVMCKQLGENPAVRAPPTWLSRRTCVLSFIWCAFVCISI